VIQVPGTIRLGKFKAVCEEERESAQGNDSYVLQQRAIIRLNDDLVRIKRAEDYTVLCDEANFHRSAGKRPSPLQYFIASIGFCMFSQMARFAAKLKVPIDDAEMAGTGNLEGGVVAEAAGGRVRRGPRLGASHGSGGIDEAAAGIEVARIEETSRRGHEIGIADVGVTVSEGELLSLGDQMQCPRVHGHARALAEVERLNELENLRNR